MVEENTVSHPKYESYIKVTEEVIKKVQVWEDEEDGILSLEDFGS